MALATFTIKLQSYSGALSGEPGKEVEARTLRFSSLDSSVRHLGDFILELPTKDLWSKFVCGSTYTVTITQ